MLWPVGCCRPSRTLHWSFASSVLQPADEEDGKVNGPQERAGISPARIRRKCRNRSSYFLLPREKITRPSRVAASLDLLAVRRMETASRRARQQVAMADLGALAVLPTELLQSEIVSRLDGVSLGRLEAVSTAFRGRVVSAERAAEETVLRLNGGDARLAARWR